MILLYNIFQIQKCIDEMSVIEKERILTKSFNELWKDLWGKSTISLYKSEEASSNKKFDTLKTGLNIDGQILNLQTFVDNSITKWSEQEWEFPKGRRNFRENDIDCALREFEEETGISRNNINVIENIVPYEEYFIGSNFKTYKHKFYISYIECNNIDLSKFQTSEVSKLEWKTLEQCIKCIRPYNLEKINIIQNINKMLEEYRFYS